MIDASKIPSPPRLREAPTATSPLPTGELRPVTFTLDSVANTKDAHWLSPVQLTVDNGRVTLAGGYVDQATARRALRRANAAVVLGILAAMLALVGVLLLFYTVWPDFHLTGFGQLVLVALVVGTLGALLQGVVKRAGSGFEKKNARRITARFPRSAISEARIQRGSFGRVVQVVAPLDPDEPSRLRRQPFKAHSKDEASAVLAALLSPRPASAHREPAPPPTGPPREHPSPGALVK